MFVNYVFNTSAFKHDVTETDIRAAFSFPLFNGLIEGYDNKYLLTGFGSRGNILEIVYNLIDEQSVNIFTPCGAAKRTVCCGIRITRRNTCLL
ncbi:MAG: hypothetical protein LBD86_03775 [Spirochaetaceae bacterium]|jgi:hypothetical protein|nr:hypothetical protein [Spirochaetaceae bacterium]